MRRRYGLRRVRPARTVHAASALTGNSNMTAYDDQNIFAKILRGEIPSFKVYETDRTFAFLDIMPRSPGHTLVIPKAPARGILDIAEDDLAAVARTAKRIAIAAVKAFAATGSSSSSSARRPAGRWCSTCICM
jgi:galactose-1-phosphate uridylyltransferase